MRSTSSIKHIRTTSFGLDVTKKADRQVLKKLVINPNSKDIDFVALKKLQAYYPNAKALFLKTTLSGEKYVSFSSPLIKQLQAKRAVGPAVKPGLANSFLGTGYGPDVETSKQKLWINMHQNGGGLVPTAEFRQAVITLAQAQQDGPTKEALKTANEQPDVVKFAAVKPEPEKLDLEDPVVTRYQNVRNQLISDIKNQPDEVKARYGDWDKHKEFANRMSHFILLHGDAFKSFCDGDDNEFNAHLQEQYPSADKSIRASMAQIFDQTPVLGLMKEKPATKMIEAYASIERKRNAL